MPHIIGRKGWVSRQLKEVYGVFFTLQDLGDSMHKMFICGPRPFCILAEFMIEMLGSGQHSVLTTFSFLYFWAICRGVFVFLGPLLIVNIGCSRLGYSIVDFFWVDLWL